MKVLSVFSSFLLSAKCRFWRISQKQFWINVFQIPSLPIKLSTLQYSAIVNNLLIPITKFIPRNAFSSSLTTVKFFPLWWAQRFNCSTINSSSPWRPVAKENIGETVLFRLSFISDTWWNSSCLIIITFLVQFYNFSFLFFSFYIDRLSLDTTWRLASDAVKEVSCVLAARKIYFSAVNSVSELFIKLSMWSSSALSTSSSKVYICSLLAFSSIWINSFYR